MPAPSRADVAPGGSVRDAAAAAPAVVPESSQEERWTTAPNRVSSVAA
jgi:hypothetical protein